MELLITFILAQLWTLYMVELNRRFAVIDHLRESLPHKQHALADVQKRAALFSEKLHQATKPRRAPRPAQRASSSLRLQFAY